MEDKVQIVFTFPKVENFDANWREFVHRKNMRKSERKQED